MLALVFDPARAGLSPAVTASVIETIETTCADSASVAVTGSERLVTPRYCDARTSVAVTASVIETAKTWVAVSVSPAAAGSLRVAVALEIADSVSPALAASVRVAGQVAVAAALDFSAGASRH